jgi:hypothetical protein
MNLKDRSSIFRISAYPEYQRYSRYVFYLSIFVLPFRFLTPTSVGIYEALIGVSALLLLLDSPSDYSFGHRPVVIALLLILVGYLFALPTAVNVMEASKFPIQFLFVIGLQLPLVYAHVTTQDRVHTILIILTATNWIILVYFSYAFLDVGIPTERYRYSLFYNNPNQLAQTVLFYFACSFALGATAVRRRSNLLALYSLPMVAIDVIIIVLTLSRRGLLGLGFFAVVVFGIRYGEIIAPSRVGARIYGFLTLVLVDLYVLWVAGALPEGVTIRIQESVSLNSPKILNRSVPMMLGLKSLRSFFFIGSGYNNYRLHVDKFVTTTFEAQFAVKPHNMYLVAWVEGGVLAFLGVLGVTAMLVKSCVRALRVGDPKTYPATFAIPIVTVVYLVISQFGTLSILRFYWFFFLMTIVIGFKVVDS